MGVRPLEENRFAYDNKRRLPEFFKEGKIRRAHKRNKLQSDVQMVSSVKFQTNGNSSIAQSSVQTSVTGALVHKSPLQQRQQSTEASLRLQSGAAVPQHGSHAQGARLSSPTVNSVI